MQLGSYKVKVMLAEPKTKRQRPEQLVPGLFGPVGALGHLPPLGLDAASKHGGISARMRTEHAHLR